MATIGARLRHAWNAFTNEQQKRNNERESAFETYYGASYGVRPDRPRVFLSNERSIISSIYARIAIDLSMVEFRHVRLDDQNRYLEDMDSELHECLTLEANLDQSARSFKQDLAFSLFDRGVCAIVPVDTTLNPNVTGGYDVKTMRVGDIVAWYPQHVKVSVWNEAVGRREDVTLNKKFVAIVENPLYAVMNEPNSTLQRLIRKLGLLDSVDEASASGKLDLIIQLPYVIKSEARREQARQRRADIEFQLKGSQYGIAYTDATEKITQLNRPAENNLMNQVQYLMDTLYAQLGVTPEVVNGTADEAVMINYNNRTIEPIVQAIQQELKRKFLTRTARAQKQSIEYFIDPFRLVPVSELAEIADKFTRNEIASSNEFRQVLGLKPSSDPKADELRNSNMPQPEPGSDDTSIMNDAFDEIDKSLDGVFANLGVDENAPEE